jgi:hypothetical protein
MSFSKSAAFGVGPRIVVTLLILVVVAALGIPLAIGEADAFEGTGDNILKEADSENYLGDGDGSDESEPLGDEDPETGQDDPFTGVQFNNPPEVVVSDSTETFEATAEVDGSLEGADFYVNPEGSTSSTYASANCNDLDDNTQCRVEAELEMPEADGDGGYKADVGVEFQIDSGPSEFAETTVNAVGIGIGGYEDDPDAEPLEPDYSVGANAPEAILKKAELRWSTADSTGTATSKQCDPQPAESCPIFRTSVDLPDGLANGDQVDIIAEYDTTQGQISATKTTTIDSVPGLEVEVVNPDTNGPDEPVSGAEVYVPGQNIRETTDDSGEATLTGVGGSVDELKVDCGGSTTTESGVDASQSDPVEIDIYTSNCD